MKFWLPFIAAGLAIGGLVVALVVREIKHPCLKYEPDECTGFHTFYCGDGCLTVIPYTYDCSVCVERQP